MQLEDLLGLSNGRLPNPKDIEKYLAQLPPEELAALDQLLRPVTAAWAPLPGPQTQAFHSQADVLFFGGAAGGGKTDLLLGLALVHYRSLIFRRVFPSLRAIIDRSRLMYQRDGADPKRDSFNESLFRWKFPGGKTIRFGSIQHDKNVLDWQGQPHDLYGFDEVTEFTRHMFQYVTAWNRPLRQGMNLRCRVVATGNPPTTKEGEWVLDFFAPWLRDDYPNPAVPGELRYFTTIDGKDVEVESGDPIKHKGEVLKPRSRTFIPSKIDDNPYLIEAGYKSQLQALPEPLRSKLLYGDFKAGVKEDPWQLIPRAWVKMAQERWKNRPVPDKTINPIEQVGVDVARGGNDRTVLSPRTGNYFHEQSLHPGITTDDGNKVAALVVQLGLQPKTIVAIDGIGVGTSPIDILKASNYRVWSLIASHGSEARDMTGMLGFVNKRAEWYWKLREALDPNTGEDLAIPDDKELLQDLCEPKFELTVRGIKVEAKDDVKVRLGRSPDKGDALVYANVTSSGPGEGLFLYYQQQYQELQKELAAKAKQSPGGLGRA